MHLVTGMVYYCPLLFEIHSRKCLGEGKKEKLEELPKSFHISERDKKKFIVALKTTEIAERLTSLSSSKNLETQELTSQITNLLIETCNKAGLKPSNPKHRPKVQEPWFDDECQKLKTSIKNKCRKLRKKHKDDALHTSILKANKCRQLRKKHKDDALHTSILKANKCRQLRKKHKDDALHTSILKANKCRQLRKKHKDDALHTSILKANKCRQLRKKHKDDALHTSILKANKCRQLRKKHKDEY